VLARGMNVTLEVCRILLRADLADTTREDVADKLCISPSSMARALSVEGTSYNFVLNKVRWHKVAAYIRDNPHPRGPQLYLIAGYSQTNTFYRAYKRNTGKRWKEAMKERNDE
jgi:AraC-like DNA-binding protein